MYLKQRVRWLKRLAAVVAVVTIAGLSNPCDAAVHEDLNEAMRRMSDEIVSFVKNTPDARSSIMIGSFEGPSIAAGGSAIVHALKEHLGDQVEVVDTGAYKVTGEFEGQKRPVNGQPRFVVLIEAVIRNRLGSKVQVLRERVVTDVQNEIALFGASVDLSQAASGGNETTSDSSSSSTPVSAAQKPIQSEEEAADRIAESISNPTVAVGEGSNSIVMISKESPYGLELVVKQGGKYSPCTLDPKQQESGIAKVGISPDEVFGIRLYNTSETPVGVAITIDGISDFAFSQNPHFKQLGKWVIPPGESLIKGWHHEGPIVHEFLITKYADSAAAQFSATDGLGAVTATYFPAFAGAKSDSSPPGVKFGAGRGKKAEMNITTQAYKIGSKPIGAVTIRYLRPSHPSDLPD